MPEITNFPGATAYDVRGVPTIPATFPVDPAPQFRAAWLHIAKMGNRVVGTTAERSAAAAWAWNGLVFYDTTEKREYIRQGGAWLAHGARLAGADSAVKGEVAAGDALMIQTGNTVVTTDVGGAATITFPVPFPKGFLSIAMFDGDPSAVSSQRNFSLYVGSANTTLSAARIAVRNVSGAAIVSQTVRVVWTAYGC